MRTTILTAWVAGILLACLGGCPSTASRSDETLLLAGEGDSATNGDATIQGDSATAGDTPADASTGSSTPASTGWVGLLYPLRPASTDSAGQDSAAGSGADSSAGAAAAPTLDDPILAAVDFVMTQFVTAAEVFGTLGELGSPNLNFNPYQAYEWGTCPIVRVAVGENAIGTLIGLDFGDGCSAPSTAGQVIVGEGGGLNYTEGQPPSVIFAYVTIDGHEVVNLLPYPADGSGNDAIMIGTMTLSGLGLDFTGTCGFEVEGIGGTAGSLVLNFGSNYTQTYGQADFTFTDGNDQQAATFVGVSVAPALHGNFLPDSGTATFTVSAADGPHTVEVQFTASTPAQRIVYVSIDGGAPFSHTLPS
jgi:hypothetical protein